MEPEQMESEQMESEQDGAAMRTAGSGYRHIAATAGR